MLKKLNRLLDKQQKLKMVGIVLLMIIGAVLETCSIAFVIPVLQLIMDAEALQNNEIIMKVYNALHMSSIEQFTILMLVALIALFVLKNVFLLFQNIIQYRFVYTNQFKTSERMMISYMKRPYEYFLSADTAVVQRSITSDVNNMFALILSILQLLSEVIIFGCIIVVTLFLEPVMTMVLAVLLIATIYLIKKGLKPVMEKAGQENRDYYSGLFKWIQQSVTGIKEIKIANRETYFVDEYIKCGQGYVNAVQKYSISSSTPRLLIETVCIAGMLGYMIIMIAGGNDIQGMVPLLGAFGFAAVRLMPSANRINNHLTSISYFKPFMMDVSDNLQDEISDEKVRMDSLKKPEEKLAIKEKVELKGITYAYPNTDVLIFDHADMEIPLGSAVGIVGTSGAGKSTVVDILLGLLQLKEGQILADGIDVLEKDNYRKWLNNIGYIPQSIFMLDDTIRKNVAFGISDDKIDEKRLWEVLKEAQLDEFVKGLPEGLDTGIGERGIRLSGGQRQRIGIARALYDDPEVLVLDEATSALDNDTEAAIMDSINSLHGRKTLVIIAHRLNTIEQCEMIYRIEGGKAFRER
ncbi:MAG: ABC transporter ATP-binding protein [Lachnospiraceae bacterium]|nr:ABC transporter ATP-binding protein [Lachnospiraceae bacterium]